MVIPLAFKHIVETNLSCMVDLAEIVLVLAISLLFIGLIKHS